VAFLISKGRAILGDDMGLGKTRQAIVGMQIAAPTGMILVVCPASLKLNWRREIRMVDPDAKVEVVGISEEKPADPRWIIVNYDLLARNAERLHDISWSGVILDEAHFIKNNSQRTSHCLKLLGVSNICSDVLGIHLRGASSRSLSGTATPTEMITAGLRPEPRILKS
jgi:SWI/SNF-related matrix-associated actin-dependent regulator of chromatin subfamily A-like protein 1